MAQLPNSQIKDWIGYWHRGQVVNISEIGSLTDVRDARMACRVMRDGLFSNVTDEAIWAAIQEWRADESARAHEDECKSAATAYLRERARRRAA